VTSEDTEKKIDELQTSRDYTTLMELAHFDEIEITRNMALFAIGELSHDENDEGTMDRTVDFLSQTIHQDIFPTIFGEFESFSPFGYFEGGTFSMAAAQLAFLPQWNKKFQTKKINDVLFSIAKENKSQSVQLSCATALLFIDDKRCLTFFEKNLNSREQDQDYRDSVLTPGVKRVAIEAGVAESWYKYVGLEGGIVAMSTYGESAPAGELFKYFGFTVDNVVSTVERVLS